MGNCVIPYLKKKKKELRKNKSHDRRKEGEICSCKWIKKKNRCVSVTFFHLTRGIITASQHLRAKAVNFSQLGVGKKDQLTPAAFSRVGIKKKKRLRLPLERAEGTPASGSGAPQTACRYQRAGSADCRWSAGCGYQTHCVRTLASKCIPGGGSAFNINVSRRSHFARQHYFAHVMSDLKSR